MEYEKIHEAAVTLGRKLIEKNPELKDWAVKIMPELYATEEQELIDKIINLIQEVRNDEAWHDAEWIDDAIEWLKTVREAAGQPLEQHKFKIGDYVVGKFLRGRVTAITDDAYLLDAEMKFPFTEEDNVHLWSLEDCQSGDVIAGGECPIVILFKKWDDMPKGCAFAYAGIGTDGNLQITDGTDEYWILDDNMRMATPKESAALFAMLKNEGYEWDAANKTLKKDLSNLISGILAAEAEESLGDLIG